VPMAAGLPPALPAAGARGSRAARAPLIRRSQARFLLDHAAVVDGFSGDVASSARKTVDTCATASQRARRGLPPLAVRGERRNMPPPWRVDVG
jgi:hypothetical protein